MSNSYVQEAYNTLVESMEEAKGMFKFVGKIKIELQEMQDKSKDAVTKRRIEVRKDRWAELHTRLYKEVYLINRVLLPELRKIEKIDNIETDVKNSYVSYDINDEEIMKAVYNSYMTSINKRVFALRDKAYDLIVRTNSKILKQKLENAIELFDKQVLPCVADNIYNQRRFMGHEVDKGVIKEEVENIITQDAEILNVQP